MPLAKHETPDYYLSQDAIRRRMRREGDTQRGLRRLVYQLHTESVFMLENLRLAKEHEAEGEHKHARQLRWVAMQINLPKARLAFKRIQRFAERGAKAPPNMEKALRAFNLATASRLKHWRETTYPE